MGLLRIDWCIQDLHIYSNRFRDHLVNCSVVSAWIVTWIENHGEPPQPTQRPLSWDIRLGKWDLAAFITPRTRLENCQSWNAMHCYKYKGLIKLNLRGAFSAGSADFHFLSRLCTCFMEALHYSQSLTVHQNSGSDALNVLRPKFRFGSASFDSCCLPVLAWELPATICSKQVFFLQQLQLLAKPCAIWIHFSAHLVPVDASRSSTCPSSGQSQCYFAVLIQEYPGNLLV